MAKLNVINGTTVEKFERRMKFIEGYSRIFANAIAHASKKYNALADFDTEIRKKIFFSGVKFINSLPSDSDESYDSLMDRFQIMDFINTIASELTTKDIQKIFPIEKRYNGARYEIKDYFYTKKFIEEYGENQKIGDLFEFLWDYQNIELKIYTINQLNTMSLIRKAQGHKSILGEFFEEQGVPTYSMYKDKNGKEILINNSTGEISKVKKQIPRYLRVVK